MELKFDAPQDEPFTGWSIMPHMKPCRVSTAIQMSYHSLIYMYVNI